MITLCISIIILILGYRFYGKVIERIFGAEPERPTPAISKTDGVDFVKLPLWKIFLIQFLNIAGLGPIFGAVAGALWGPVAFVWIVLGSLFAGGVHDYFCGMLSVRHEGESVSEVSGYYLGSWIKQFMRGFTVLLMIIVGAVFLLGPAKILAGMTEGTISLFGWTMIILVYYMLSTILPIDKIIGRLYPVFGFALLFMSLGLFAAMIFQGMNVPELGLSGFTNFHYESEDFPVFPMLFVTIACGAISGFHATQSPLMARCISNEKQGKKVFYGAMVTEGMVALIWAAISMGFFGGIKELNMEMLNNGDNTALMVNKISNGALGTLGGLLAILGVVAAPITSGDTSFRSARIIIADFMKADQKSIKNRLMISIPLFLVGYLLTLVNFGVIWRYFAWTNQMLATIVLWTVSVYLIRQDKNYWIALIPSVFMTAVVVAYILLAPEGFSFPIVFSVTVGVIIALALMGIVLFRVPGIKKTKTGLV
ncbi:carbon starvation protein A [Sinomicrobium pectinilyticum]|uniref:Carbon starvation protein A n=1 Tax=Sinomicrobium pectinilyticum TaxID=1084421 RepID=A0A3N0E3Y0_SINP1|nr:carbon starvation protein A [Sinomicrobium pectinilyticum]RNL82503.1 carbon starvation protein A [Sinomicrobium pectinilyticum]